MSISSVVETFRDGGREAADKSGTLTYRRVFQVHTTTINDNLGDILVASAGGVSIPARGAAHPTESTALVESVSAKQTDRPYYYLVTVDYSTAAKTSSETSTNPTDRAVVISKELAGGTLVMDRGYVVSNGNIANTLTNIRNIAGDPYSPRPEVGITSAVYVFERIEDNIGLGTVWDNTINSGAWNGFPKWTLRLNVTAQSFTERGATYFRVRYNFEYNRKTWMVSLVEAGYRYRDGSDNPIDFVDKNGVKYTSPAFLNSDGTGELAKNAAPFVSTWMPEEYEAKDFSLLGLPWL